MKIDIKGLEQEEAVQLLRHADLLCDLSDFYGILRDYVRHESGHLKARFDNEQRESPEAAAQSNMSDAVYGIFCELLGDYLD